MLRGNVKSKYIMKPLHAVSKSCHEFRTVHMNFTKLSVVHSVLPLFISVHHVFCFGVGYRTDRNEKIKYEKRSNIIVDGVREDNANHANDFSEFNKPSAGRCRHSIIDI